MIFLIGNLKGGVGKTTLAVNLAITLSNSHRDVLLIDAEGSAIDLTELRANARGTAGYTAVNLQGANIRTQARQLAHKGTLMSPLTARISPAPAQGEGPRFKF